MDDATAGEIDAALKKVIAKVAPDIRYVPKYGGEVLAPIPDDDTKFVGGIFRSKGHISLEFSHGATFNDPQSLLQGKGKARRHLKFETVKDVAKLDVERFLSQALSRS